MKTSTPYWRQRKLDERVAKAVKKRAGSTELIARAVKPHGAEWVKREIVFRSLMRLERAGTVVFADFEWRPLKIPMWRS